MVKGEEGSDLVMALMRLDGSPASACFTFTDSQLEQGRDGLDVTERERQREEILCRFEWLRVLMHSERLTYGYW